MTSKKISRYNQGQSLDIYNVSIDDLTSGGEPPSFDIEVMSPKKIVEQLDRYVIGQRKAKQLLSIAAFNRLLSFTNKRIGRDVENEYYFEKNNILLVGGTGCGKTHLVRSLSRILSLPVTVQDATSFTSAGYVGGNVEDAVVALFKESLSLCSKMDSPITSLASYSGLKRNYYDEAEELTEHGIIYIDEADKIRDSKGSGKDVNGRGVQEAFLKLIEGTKVPVTMSRSIDTSNILFIFGGAFSGLEQIVSQRINKKEMGFIKSNTETNKAQLLHAANIKDFTDFGMMPEIMGRLSTIAVLDELTAEMVYKIFTEPKRSILSQVVNEFKSFGVDVAFSDCAIDYIVSEAVKLKLGARALKSSCQNILRPLYYLLPSMDIDKKVIVTRELLESLKDE